MGGTLWFDYDQQDYFVVADDLPEGEVWLRTFDGRVRGFDADALEACRVDADEARRHVHAWAESGFQRARDAFARGYGDEAPVPSSLEAALGVAPERLGNDPEALLAAARHLGGRLQGWLDAAPPDVANPIRTASAALAELLAAVARGATGEE